MAYPRFSLRGALPLISLIVAAALFVPTYPAAATTPLIGTFTITAGSCSGGTASGSYIRMILPSGSTSGPFMSNSDSTCSDQSYTLLRAGSDGGLASGSYQPPPNPAFDAKGNALAQRITAPATYYGTAFATGSSAKDPQTGAAVPAPRVWANGGSLGADLRAFAVTWNNQNFNQGAPKPDGSLPGNTRRATGTYNASTGDYTLQWTSQVVGGPFDKFTGLWHLTGRFVPSTTAGGSSGHSSGGGSAGSGGQLAHGGATHQSIPGAVAVLPQQRTARARSQSAASRGPATNTPGGVASPVASTVTVSRERWQITWWLIAVALGVAAAGILALLAINRRLRTGIPS